MDTLARNKRQLTRADILPPGAVRISSCKLDGADYKDFDATALTVKLPKTGHSMKVEVTLTPTKQGGK